MTATLAMEDAARRKRRKPAARQHPGARQARDAAAARRFARACRCPPAHPDQVARLALALFDQLRSLHRLGRKDRQRLEWAARLHDIGWLAGRQGHHKTALRLILNAPDLPFTPRQRLVIGSIARYHRRAFPDCRHAHFRALSAAERVKVRRLAALLRLADGLDSLHTGAVQALSCSLAPRRIGVAVKPGRNLRFDPETAREKGRLLEHVFRRKITLAWKPGPGKKFNCETRKIRE